MGRPTEEERLAWEERQQKREKLSNTMGQYLLKGYRMLGTNCKDCGVSLLSHIAAERHNATVTKLTEICWINSNISNTLHQKFAGLTHSEWKF